MANSIAALGWHTSNTGVGAGAGKFYNFGTQGVFTNACAINAVGKTTCLVFAGPVIPGDVPADYQAAGMNTNFDIKKSTTGLSVTTAGI